MKTFFRKLLALALLPVETIPEAFDWLVTNATAEIREYFGNMLQYYLTWWLTRVTPPNFSIFSFTHRTNNVIEAYHRVLDQRMGDHPSIWRFTGKFFNPINLCIPFIVGSYCLQTTVEFYKM